MCSERSIMKPNGILIIFTTFTFIRTAVTSQCSERQAQTFVRWSGVTPERIPPVFVYSASGDEESLTGACLARCRELEDCAGVAVAYGRGNCHGVAHSTDIVLKADNDVSYFRKICLELAENCGLRWWALESTPGYYLHAEGSSLKTIFNITVQACYEAVLSTRGTQKYRSAQWVGAEGLFDPEQIKISNADIGNCILSEEDKFTEPESYRVSNYYTFYIENQCRHDYPKKIDRCSYEEYNNQTLRHVEFTVKNNTKDQCKASCEVEERFICRGFTWTPDRHKQAGGNWGLCDLHSEDLVTTGSWLLRRTTSATYYRRVICLNISVECDGSNLVVTYRPRGAFRGRMYVPGRGERCSSRAASNTVRLSLPLHGDCDVNFAHAISNSPTGLINRTMAYVMVMIQNNPIIQTAGDRWVRVGCLPGARTSTHVDATVTVRDSGKPSVASESAGALFPAAASAVFNSNSAPLTMYVVRAQDSGEGSAVSLGESLELRIETTDETEIEAYHLVASSRLGDSSVLLLDNKGCPTGQVDFPSFTRTLLSGTQRLSARFKAFRFPSSHIVRFALMVRFCEIKCSPLNCGNSQNRTVRGTNETLYDGDAGVAATVKQDELENNRIRGVVAQGGATGCGNDEGRVPLELEMIVGAKDILSADTLIRADHRGTLAEESESNDGPMVCIHELLLVALVLAWLAVQVLLLLGCCVLVKRYRNLAELSMQKEYQSFDNVGFDTVSTHRRVHWPDQSIDMLHTN